MSNLENKINAEEGRLKGFLKEIGSGIKTALNRTVLASALAASAVSSVACNGGGGSGGGGGGNTAPSITTTAPTGPWIQGDNYQYDVDATDPDGDPLTYSLVSPPPGPGISSSNGFITWPSIPSGNHNLTVRAEDGKGGIDDQNFTINVTGTGTVDGIVTDIQGSRLGNVVFHVYNSTYPKGTYKVTSSTATVTPNATISGIPPGTYTVECEDGNVNVHRITIPSAISVTAGNTTTARMPKVIARQSFASSNVSYRDANNNANWMQFFKYETGTLTTDTPSGGPHNTRTWASKTLNVFYDITNAPTTDNEMADGSAGSNSVPDYVDRARLAVASWATATTGLTFNEVSSNPTTGIRFNWVTSPSTPGLTTINGYDSNGYIQHAKIDIDDNLTIGNNLQKLIAHETGHALFKPGPTTVGTNYPNNAVHSADTQYLLHSTPTPVTPTSDEQNLVKHIFALGQNPAGTLGTTAYGTNMDYYFNN